ncbi:MAG: hypothetical protein BWX88_04872 [Planctomycetes bacterium ADurb.Bin126]|nr:MAG: hypothetical protein BWX88_04872 [Planctomycetes bacterium ADurb.Bin126]
MATSDSQARDRQGQHEHRCPVCGWPIKASLQWHFQEFCCSRCDTYLRWEGDDRGHGRWIKAGVYA